MSQGGGGGAHFAKKTYRWHMFQHIVPDPPHPPELAPQLRMSVGQTAVFPFFLIQVVPYFFSNIDDI